MAERMNESPAVVAGTPTAGTRSESSAASADATPPRPISLLFANGNESGTTAEQQDCSYASDLNLDQIVAAIARVQEEKDFIANLVYRHVDDIDTVHYRH